MAQVLRVLGTGSCRESNPKYYEFRKRYYKLYYRFKPRYHYWGQVILLRKFLVVLCTIFLKSNPTLQATTALMILFVSYSVHNRALPYLRNDLLGAGDADMEKASQDSSEKQRISRLGSRTSAGSLANMVGGVDDGEGKEQASDGESEESAITIRERALTLINKNPKSMSVSRSLRKTKRRASLMGSKLSALTQTMSRHSMSSMTTRRSMGSMTSRHNSMGSMTHSDSSDAGAAKCVEEHVSSPPRPKSAATASESPSSLTRLGSISELKGGEDGTGMSPLHLLSSASDAPDAPSSYWEEDANGHYKDVTGDSRASSMNTEKSRRLEALLRTRSEAGQQAAGGGGGGASSPSLQQHSSMYGVHTPAEAEAPGDGEDGEDGEDDDDNNNSLAANMKMSKSFLMDYNTMETIFHFCSILILLCALMFESGSKGDLSGGEGGSTAAKRNAAFAAAPTWGDATVGESGAGADAGQTGANDGAEHYLLVFFVISVVAVSSIYFMFALLSEVIRSFSHYARVMRQRKEGKTMAKAKEVQAQVEMTQRCVVG